MPRQQRIHYPGAVYHVMARGVDGRAVFIDDKDRQHFLRTLLRFKKEAPFSVLAYCLMGNHFHLAIRVGSVSLADIMRRLLTSYVMTFNKRHERTGHLFQARYKAILCLDDVYLLALIRYIHMNPVRGGLASAPREWPWSSHRAYIGEEVGTLVDTHLVSAALSNFTPSTGTSYDEWTRTSDPEFEPWPKPTDEHKPALLQDSLDGRLPLDRLAGKLFENTGVLRSKRHDRATTAMKAVFAKAAVQEAHSLTEIARWLSCSPSLIHYLLRKD